MVGTQVPPLTPCGIRIGGELSFGRDSCYVTEKGWGLAKYNGPPLGNAPCVRGFVTAYLSILNPFGSYFVGEFDGLTLGDLVAAFGTDQQASTFNKVVPRLLRDSGFKPTRWSNGKEGCNGNPCMSFSPALVPVLTSNQRRVLPGLRMFGELTILGVTGVSLIVIDPSVPFLLMEAKLHPIVVGNGAIKITKTGSDELEGPTLRIEAALANERPPLASLVQSIGKKILAGERIIPTRAELRDGLAVNVSGTMQGTISLFGARVSVLMSVTNSGFGAQYSALIGDGFQADISLRAPFAPLTDLSFTATVLLKADFGRRLTDATIDAVRDAGASVTRAGLAVRELAASASASARDADETKSLFDTVDKAVEEVVGKATALLTKCTGLCQKALGKLLAAVESALSAARLAKDDLQTMYGATVAASKAAIASANTVASDLVPVDKVWADVVEVASASTEIIHIEKALFRATIGGNAKTKVWGATFDVEIEADVFGKAISLAETMAIDLTNITATGAALAEKIRAKATEDLTVGRDWAAHNWEKARARVPRDTRGTGKEVDVHRPLSELIMVASSGSSGTPACATKQVECARTAFNAAATKRAALHALAAAAQSTQENLDDAADVLGEAVNRFFAAAVAKGEALLDVSREAANGFTTAVQRSVGTTTTNRLQTAKSDGVAALAKAKQVRAQ